ncbi:hypothetical protein G0Q06_02115 [Puniceicoccales bacterium CK1056]|uniref:TonB C-terminal domain-containing protein n=1 Tax=Oceanipulchritudo coccoides TaxID=2706888 RepID=A0A6B2LXE4_9BACT|nr:energy transducer TonB [Oceanipulchritudo coccoides]NDV61241.1 hypothetical protein [Oceanipulchritudo coccoides]
MKLIRTISLFLLTLALLNPSSAFAGETSMTEKLNEMVGRKLYVDPADIPGKIHTWKDVKKWYPARGKDPLRMSYPESLKGTGISEMVTVRLIITPEGNAINPKIEDLQNKELAIPAILHVAGLRFQVPKINGEPVYLSQKIKLKCSEDPDFGKK